MPLRIGIRSELATHRIRKMVLLGVVTFAMVFTSSKVALSENTLKALSASTSSPVELVLIDPQGRKSGFDPITKTLFEDIPTSAYTSSQICDEQTFTGCSAPYKTLDMANQMDGQYTLEVIGTGAGDFTVVVERSDAAGNWITHFYSGTTAPGRISRFTFPGKVVTFASFGATLKISSASKAFEMNGTFTLGPDGVISLETQPVSIELPNLLLTIPVGSFSQTRQGTFVFAGVIEDVHLAAELTLIGGKSYAFQVRATGVSVPPGLPSANPVDVLLAIGNNGASMTVNANFVP